MTSPRRFEQELPALIGDTYLAGTPDYRDDLVQQLAAVRQRPGWTFPERWIPMDLVTKAVPGAPRIPWRALGIVALLAVLIAAMLAFAIGSQQRLPEPFGLAANGTIAYSDGGDILARDDLSDAPKLLLGGAPNDHDPYYSPDGTRLNFVRTIDGKDYLMMADTDGSNVTQILSDPLIGAYGAWSPDSRSIALVNEVDGITRLSIVQADGSGVQPIDLGRIHPTEVAWRPPDGRQLLFRGRDSLAWGFYLVDVASGGSVRLDIGRARTEAGDFDYDNLGATWSPSGDRLAFHTLEDLPSSGLGTPGFRIHVATIGPAGEIQDRQRLEFDPVADDELNAQFTPDGRQLVFQARVGPTDPGPTDHTPTVDTLHLAPADGSGPAIDLGVKSTGGGGIAYAVAPDGTSLLAHFWTENQDWIIDPVAGTATLTDIASSGGISWQRRAP